MPEKYIEKPCKTHGLVAKFVYEVTNRRYKCVKCRSEAVQRRRIRVKDMLLDALGGKCRNCNYDKCSGALDFHHLIPSEKEFAISGKGWTISYARLLKEAEKCIILCANCHREVGCIKHPKH
jgi:5-methylcytosine-specific restriction endonuclease McrA